MCVMVEPPFSLTRKSFQWLFSFHWLPANALNCRFEKFFIFYFIFIVEHCQSVRFYSAIISTWFLLLGSLWSQLSFTDISLVLNLFRLWFRSILNATDDGTIFRFRSPVIASVQGFFAMRLLFGFEQDWFLSRIQFIFQFCPRQWYEAKAIFI